MSCKEAKRQFIWGLRIVIWGITDSGGTENSVPLEEMGRGFYGEKEEVHAGLHKQPRIWIGG